VAEVKKSAVAAQVRVDIGGGNVLTSMITVDAVEDLGLRRGDRVSVVITVARGRARGLAQTG
jgi:molybdopterin-binding protein